MFSALPSKSFDDISVMKSKTTPNCIALLINVVIIVLVCHGSSSSIDHDER